MTACLFFSASANADIICVKNKVAAQGSVVLNGKINVVKKDSCPKGFSKLLSTDEFKGPQGEKGEKGERGEDGDAAFYQNVLPAGTTVTGYVKTVSRAEARILYPDASAFKVPAPVSLPMPSTVEIDDKSIGTDKDCTGSVANPTAPAGKVCLYGMNGMTATVTPIKLGNMYTQDECLAHNLEWICEKCMYCGCSCIDPSDENAGQYGYSRQAFNVVGSDAPFEGVWAYTVPEAE